MTVQGVQESGLEMFFNTIKWVFTDFLIRIEILGIPVLYYLLALAVLGIIIAGVLSTVSSFRLSWHIRSGGGKKH